MSKKKKRKRLERFIKGAVIRVYSGPAPAPNEPVDPAKLLFELRY